MREKGKEIKKIKLAELLEPKALSKAKSATINSRK